MPGGVRIGSKLKEVRISRLPTQQELAEKAGLSPGTVVNIERDRAEQRFGTIRKPAKALDVEPTALLEK